MPNSVSYTHLDVYKRQSQLATELEVVETFQIAGDEGGASITLTDLFGDLLDFSGFVLRGSKDEVVGMRRQRFKLCTLETLLQRKLETPLFQLADPFGEQAGSCLLYTSRCV